LLVPGKRGVFSGRYLSCETNADHPCGVGPGEARDRENSGLVPKLKDDFLRGAGDFEPIRRSDRSRTLVWLYDSIERLVFCLCLLLVGRVHLQMPFLPSLFLIWQSLITESVTSRAVRRA
jgi:hypothetical protein